MLLTGYSRATLYEMSAHSNGQARLHHSCLVGHPESGVFPAPSAHPWCLPVVSGWNGVLGKAGGKLQSVPYSEPALRLPMHFVCGCLST